ncbi:MAG: HEAT repeat domain-containing protein [Byssovorax sp.]
MRTPTFSARLGALLLGLGLFTAGEARAFVWPNVPDQIARALASGDVFERRLAAQRLPELPPEIALRLVQEGLADPDVEVRLRVAQAAISLRMPKAGDQVMAWLSEGDPRIRLAACDVIRASPTDRSVVALGRVLGDPDAHVRLAAAAAMGSSGMSEAVSPLLGHLDDTSPEVREEVARALGRIGDPKAVVPLIGKVQDSVPDVRKTTARALGELGDPRATSALMLALQDASAEVRLEAVGALGRLRADEATEAIAPLIEAAEAPDVSPGTFAGRPTPATGIGSGEVRAAALRALGRIGSEAAVKVLIAALGRDDPGAARSPVREALASAGKPAATALSALLAGSPSQNSAAGAALVLGALRAPEGEAAITRAMQRGVLPLRQGLRALAQIGSGSALPTVLELLDDNDPTVRKEAIRAAMALLDPARADGRPIDPASAALRDAATPSDEKIELVRMLGRTGAPRAQAVLLPLLSARSIPLRLAVIEALGTSRVASGEADAALLKLLDDEHAELRVAAAVALSRIAGPTAAPELLRRLTVAAEQDRGALGIALSGALSRATDPALAGKVREAIATVPEVARDALIEGLGRMKGPEAGAALAAIGKGSIDDRRKVAEALAGHPEQEEALRALAGDADSGVRAAAAWSLGTAGGKPSAAALTALVRDPDVAVAGNAAASLGRIAARAGDPSLAAPLCKAFDEGRPYVRANALEGLSLAGAGCEPGAVIGLLARDPSESARIAAADFLARAIARDGDKANEADRRALVRCASEDRNASVATRCARPPATPAPLAGPEDLAVYIVPEGQRAPEARAPFTLIRADGLLRLGLADRRGAIFEKAAPPGPVRLGVPAALAR